MSNQQLKVGLIALALTAILVFATAALPAVNALTPSTIYYRYAHATDRTSVGQRICGEHLCSSTDWAKMKSELSIAQRDPNNCKELKGWMYCGQPSTTPQTSG